MRLSRPDQVGWGVALRSPLTFLTMSGRRLELVCVDETGLDWPGNDEVRMSMRPDSLGGAMELLALTEGVATGRRLPIGPSTGSWTTTATGFRWHLETVFTEEDLFDQVVSRVVPALADDLYDEQRTVTYTPSGGKYTLDVHLAREPIHFAPPA